MHGYEREEKQPQCHLEIISTMTKDKQKQETE